MVVQSDSALREQETEYRAIFEASSDGLVINDPETGLVVEANPAFCRMHGYDRMVGLHPTAFIHPACHHLFEDYLRTVRDGREYRVRAQDVRRDGSVFDVEVLGRGFTYQGRFAMLGVVRDVTEGVQAYQVLEQRVAERTREIDRRRQVAEVLRNLLATVNSGRPLGEILQAVLEQGSRLLESDASALYLLDPDGAALEVQAVHPIDATWLARRIRIGLPVTGLATLKRRPVAFTDLRSALRGASAADASMVLEDRAAYLNVVRLGSPYADVDAHELSRLERLAQSHPAVLAVPLLVDGQPRGTITLYYDRAREFGDEELRLATAFADQAALAIENTRLRAVTQDRTREAEQRVRELEALYDADQLLHGSLRLDRVLQALVDVAVEILGTDSAVVYIWDAAHTQLVVGAACGLPPHVTAEIAFAMGEGIVGQVAATGQPRVVEDGPAEPDASRQGSNSAGVRAGLHVPITLADEVFGVFGVGSNRPRAFGPDEQRLLLSLAQRAGLAIQNARLYAQEEQRTRELDRRRAVAEGLRELLAVVNSGRGLPAILNSVLDQAGKLVHSDAGAVYLLESPSGALSLHASRGHARGGLVHQLAMNASVTGLAVEQRRAVACDVLAAFPRTADLAERTELHDRGAYLRVTRLGGADVTREDIAQMRRLGKRYRMMLSVPLATPAATYGAISLFYRQPRDFTDEEVALAFAFADQAALAIENARLHDQAQKAATLEERQRLARELHDAVTQTLFSTALIAEVIPDLWDADPVEGRNRLDELRRLTRGALAEMRTLLVELRPGALTELPLEELLRQLGAAVAGRSRLDVAVDVNGRRQDRLPADVQVSLYRIAQEALNNIARHANARHARVHLERELDGRLGLRIQDDGRGFDPAAVPAGHLGLGIMRERAQATGAALRVESAAGSGTRIEVRWRPRNGGLK